MNLFSQNYSNNSIETIESLPKRRILWIDTMKVIGMYFIVLGHMFPIGYKSIYAFSVPLFFFVSGILSNQKDNTRMFMRKIIQTLVVPMICFCILSLIYHILRYHLTFETVLSNSHIWLIRLITGYQTGFNIGGDIFPGLNACWFIYTLILVKIVFNFIPIRLQLLLLLPLSIMLAIYLNYNHLYLGNSFANSLLAYPIFISGFLLKPQLKYLNRDIIKHFMGWVIFIFSVIILIIIPNYNDWPQMYINGYGNNLLLFIIGIIFGLYSTYFTAMLIGKKFTNIIVTLSKGNILTLGIHSYFVAALHGAGLLNGYVDWLYALLIMLIMIPIIKFAKRFAPWVIGIQPKKT